MNDTQLEADHPVDTTSSQHVESPQDTTGTKIGAVSDFEQDLIESEVIDSPTERQTESPSDDALADEFEKHLAQDLNDYSEGDIVNARIRTVKKSGVLVDFSYKSDGFIPTNEISEAVAGTLEEGLEIKAMVQHLETKEGYSLLSESKARAELIWDDLFDIMTRKDVVEVQIKKVTNKGYTVIYDEVSGFLHKEEGDEFKEKDVVKAIIIQVDKRRKKIMFSSRNIENLLIQKEEVTKFFDTINVGDVLTGTVSGIKRFGVFINVGGAEGLVHISEISWRRISHPSDVLAIGDEVQVKVLAIDHEEVRLSLGIKQLKPDPWETIETDYEIGSIVNGKVIRVIDFGAFILLENDVEGLIHISEVSTKRIKTLDDVLTVGDSVKVKIIKITKHDQKIGLSMKFVEQDNQAITDRIEAI